MPRVHFKLVRNVKAARGRGFVAAVIGGELRFLRATIPRFEKGAFIGGEYDIPSDTYVVVKTDESSHKNERQRYTLYRTTANDVEEVAWIEYVNGSPEFSSDEVKEAYVKASGARGSRAVEALITIANQQR